MNIAKKVSIGFAVIAGSLGLVFLLFVVGKQSPSSDNTGFTSSLINAVSEDDRIKGDLNMAKAVLVEYSDFECPACGSYYPVLKKVKEDFGDSLAFVYRHFPLSQIHKNARLAAAAAEAAGLQGKFWEMHDIIFEGQRKWSGSARAKEIFLDYGRVLGLEVERFESDLESETAEKRIQEDYEDGLALGIPGTPTFYLDGKRIQNPINYGEFRALIEEAIN